MRDTSILDELNAHNKKIRGRRKYYVLALLMLLVMTGIGVAAINNNEKIINPKITASRQKIQNIQETSTSELILSPEPPPTTHTEVSSVPTLTSLPPPGTDVSMDVINAKLCRDTLSTAIEINNQNVGMYMKSWTHWGSIYKGGTTLLKPLKAKHGIKPIIKNSTANLSVEPRLIYKGSVSPRLH